MRVLVVHPGADYSVADVHRGYVKGFRALGCDVAEYNLHDRLAFFAAMAWVETGKRLSGDEIAQHAAYGLHGKLWEWDPDLLVIVSAFYLLPVTWQLLQYRRHRVAIVFTESPYEDDRQSDLAGKADPDLVVVNDPTNLDKFRAVHTNAHYVPHAYDPDVHYAGGTRARDFAFVGTAYPSRLRFLEAVDWDGIDVALAGHWTGAAGTPLERFLVHPVDECYANDDTADLYRAARASLNLYRREAAQPALSTGWAMGPREVELAACGTWFAREPRGEGDALFPMLPTVTEPDEFGAVLRWALAHDDEREHAARRARAAIADRTFTTNAAQLLTLAGE